MPGLLARALALTGAHLVASVLLCPEEKLHSYVLVTQAPSVGDCSTAVTDDYSRSAEYSSSSYCWNVVNTTSQVVLPTGTPEITFATECNILEYAGTIVIGAPASLEEKNGGFFDNSLKLRRNCELFAQLVQSRGGIMVSGSAYSVKCAFVGDSATPLLTTAATARVVHDHGADFLLSPYGSGLTIHASKQAVVDGRLMLSPSGSSPAIYSEALTMFNERSGAARTPTTKRRLASSLSR